MQNLISSLSLNMGFGTLGTVPNRLGRRNFAKNVQRFAPLAEAVHGSTQILSDPYILIGTQLQYASPCGIRSSVIHNACYGHLESLRAQPLIDLEQELHWGDLNVLQQSLVREHEWGDSEVSRPRSQQATSRVIMKTLKTHTNEWNCEHCGSAGGWRRHFLFDLMRDS